MVSASVSDRIFDPAAASANQSPRAMAPKRVFQAISGSSRRCGGPRERVPSDECGDLEVAARR